MTLSTPNSFRSLAFAPPPQVATTVLAANFASCIIIQITRPGKETFYTEKLGKFRQGNLDKNTLQHSYYLVYVWFAVEEVQMYVWTQSNYRVHLRQMHVCNYKPNINRFSKLCSVFVSFSSVYITQSDTLLLQSTCEMFNCLKYSLS